MRYIGAGTHLAALTGGQLPSEVQQHHQVVRVNGAELYPILALYLIIV